MIALVKLRILDTDENFSLRGDSLKKAMEEDKKNGLVPFFVSATLGTTSCCSFDALAEIGPICSGEGKEKIKIKIKNQNFSHSNLI